MFRMCNAGFELRVLNGISWPVPGVTKSLHRQAGTDPISTVVGVYVRLKIADKTIVSSMNVGRRSCAGISQSILTVLIRQDFLDEM